jgi:hypothetical protein
MDASQLAVAVKDSAPCAGCTMSVGEDVTTSSVTLTRNAMAAVKIWNPSDSASDVNGSQKINKATHGALTKMFMRPLPFNVSFSVTIEQPGGISFTLPSPPSSMSLMSIYYPFPLRIEGIQPDACFQIGEFNSKTTGNDYSIAGTSIVVLIPLKKGVTASGPAASFIDTIAGRMPGVVVGTDPKNGYSDVTVAGLSEWRIADILKTDRPFYSWMNRDGTRVVVMAEPIVISASTLGSITTALAVATPESDVIHEMGPTLQYKAAPPATPAAPVRVTQPPVAQTRGGESKDFIASLLSGVGYFVIAVLAVYLGLRFALGPGAGMIEKLGSGLASLYSGVRSAATSAASGVKQQLGPKPRVYIEPPPPTGRESDESITARKQAAIAAAIGAKKVEAAEAAKKAENDIAAKKAESDIAERKAENDRQKAIAAKKIDTSGPNPFVSGINPMFRQRRPKNQPKPTEAEMAGAAGTGLRGGGKRRRRRHRHKTGRKV